MEQINILPEYNARLEGSVCICSEYAYEYTQSEDHRSSFTEFRRFTISVGKSLEMTSFLLMDVLQPALQERVIDKTSARFCVKTIELNTGVNLRNEISCLNQQYDQRCNPISPKDIHLPKIYYSNSINNTGLQS